MNRDRRKRLRAVIEQAEQLVLKPLAAIAEEEQEALDNMPESLQLSDRWADMETASETLEEAADSLGEIIEGLEELI